MPKEECDVQSANRETTMRGMRACEEVLFAADHQAWTPVNVARRHVHRDVRHQLVRVDADLWLRRKSDTHRDKPDMPAFLWNRDALVRDRRRSRWLDQHHQATRAVLDCMASLLADGVRDLPCARGVTDSALESNHEPSVNGRAHAFWQR